MQNSNLNMYADRFGDEMALENILNIVFFV